jgi:hypothetical protein
MSHNRIISLLIMFYTKKDSCQEGYALHTFKIRSRIILYFILVQKIPQSAMLLVSLLKGPVSKWGHIPFTCGANSTTYI